MVRFRHGLAVAGSRFSWENGMGYAEHSSLRDVQLHQVWDDACDMGFTVASHKTQSVVTFVETDTVRDSEGDITSWRFTAINPRTGRVDTASNALRITIWND